MDSREFDKLWFSFQPIPGVAFGLNDSVCIMSGEQTGELVSVISLAALEPSPVYLVELHSGTGAIEIVEVDLERAV